MSIYFSIKYDNRAINRIKRLIKRASQFGYPVLIFGFNMIAYDNPIRSPGPTGQLNRFRCHELFRMENERDFFTRVGWSAALFLRF